MREQTMKFNYVLWKHYENEKQKINRQKRLFLSDEERPTRLLASGASKYQSVGRKQ